MKINFLLAALATTTIISCSTSYKTGQTPDDVYYSPARLQTDNVRKDDDNKKVQDNSVYTTPEDRDIRRRVHNRRYRRYDDRYDYPYGYNNGYNGYNNGYPVYTNPKINTTQNTSQPRKTNLGAYSPNTTTPDSTRTFNPKLGSQNNTSPTNPVRTFGTPASPNNGSSVGNLIRRIFNGDSNPGNNYHNNNSYNSSKTFENTNNNNNSNTRTFERTNNNSNTNTNTNTQSAPATNSTSAPVRTFKKDD